MEEFECYGTGEAGAGMTTRKRCLVAILAWNNVSDTVECLGSLRDLDRTHYGVVVIDNGSRVEIADELRNRCEKETDVQFVGLPCNYGFAGGYVNGLHDIDLDAYEFVLLLNNDALVSPRTLDAFVTAARQESADIAGPTITYYPESEVIWQSGGYVQPLTYLLRVPLKNRASNEVPARAIAVDFVSGCALLVSTRYIKNYGFLDSAYFYSVEDFDFCYGAKRRGAKVYWLPQFIVGHKVSVSAGGWNSLFAVEHFLWGRSYFLKKYTRGVRFWLALLCHFAVVLPGKMLRVDKDRFSWKTLSRCVTAALMGLRGIKLNARPSGGV